MADQNAAQRAREVGEQAAKNVNELADAGMAQAEKLADQAGQQLDAAQEQAQNLSADTPNQLQEAQKQGRELLDQATAQTQQLSKEAQAKLRDVAEQASKGVDQATKATGGKLRTAADSVRSYAPESGPTAEVTRQFATSLEQSGAYLERQSASGIIADVADFARRRPILIGLIGAGILILLLRSFRRSK